MTWDAMIEAELSERVGDANALMALADKIDDEALNWRDPMKAELQRSARMLFTIGRAVLTGNTDQQHAHAYTEAGATILGRSIGARRLQEVIDTPPRKRGDGK